MKAPSSVIGITVLVFILVVSGCAPLVRPPAGPHLAQLPPEETASVITADDGDLRSLEEAVLQSVRYYERLPETVLFHYGDISYTPREMIASMDLFLSLTAHFEGDELIRHLNNAFIFFESRNSDGRAFFTGYYEPLLEGRRAPEEGFTSALFATPGDLIEVYLGQFSEKWENEKIVGRLRGNRLVPYDSRSDIVYRNSLGGRAEVIAYVNEIELFFLQIQGSGLIRLPGGRIERVNYASQNGHAYRAIGRILKDKIPPDEMSMQAIKAYLYSHPDEVRDILSYNESYTFFRTVEEGPLGDINVPLTPERSIAMDRAAVPRGGLAFVITEVPVFSEVKPVELKPFRRFMAVQDTGGAIRGHGRADIFFGNGTGAELAAGHMKQQGRIILFVARKEFLKFDKNAEESL